VQTISETSVPAAAKADRPEYVRPTRLTQAVALMAEGGWRVLAGATDLYPGAGARLQGPVLDITGLGELTGLVQDGGLRIGAGTSWGEIVGTDLPPACQALQQAARVVGGRQIQAAGTIGGNLCNASPAADGVPPLMALGAEVELVSVRGIRRLKLDEFILGPRRTALAPDELMTAILVPEAGLLGRSAFVKLGARSHLVISIAMVAARLVVAEDRVAAASLAVGACSPVARRLPEVEAALLGAKIGDAVARVRADAVGRALAPIDDVRASATYRGQAAVELLRRAVAGALA
jgi:CO/xanthine dehydrogenase FAD-binding subunit